MTLLDGLDFYKSDAEWWDFTLRVEHSAVEVTKLISRYDDRPDSTALAAAHHTLIDIERWKAMCLKERMGNAERNSQRDVWDAFRGALIAGSDRDVILSIMRLKGFGSSQDEKTGQRRAKVATAVLRFLKPADWGVVDWRTIAMLGMLEKAEGDVDKGLAFAKREGAANLRKVCEIVDEQGACQVNQQYRAMKGAPFPRAVDAEMALFGLSEIAWPFKVSATVSQPSGLADC
ncbi:MAG: hypothetical protein WA655_11355 [Candidatus Korobacteraceae bacterium]